MNFTKEQVRRSNWTFALVLLIICAVTFLFNLSVVISGGGLVKTSFSRAEKVFGKISVSLGAE